MKYSHLLNTALCAVLFGLSCHLVCRADESAFIPGEPPENVSVLGIPPKAKNLQVHFTSAFVGVWYIKFEATSDELARIFDGKLLPPLSEFMSHKEAVQHMKEIGKSVPWWTLEGQKSTFSEKQIPIERGDAIMIRRISACRIARENDMHVIYVYITEEAEHVPRK